MDSPVWDVFYTLDVKNFRNTLSPEEAELFNECILCLCRNPHEDRKRTFRSRKGLPLVQFLYRDDTFVLLYRWTKVTQPTASLRIEVYKAMRVSDV